jgi:hypothetical protein
MPKVKVNGVKRYPYTKSGMKAAAKAKRGRGRRLLPPVRPVLK